MKKMQAKISYCLVHAFMWGMYAVIIYFAKTFLSAQGLSDAMCSLVLGVTAATSVFLNIAVSEVIKRNQNMKLYAATMALAALILLGLGGMFMESKVLALSGICLVLTLLQTAEIGLYGIPGCSFPLGSTGVFALGDGRFYFSDPISNAAEKTFSSTVRLYRMDETNDQLFTLCE